MGFNQSLVSRHERQERNRFWRREREVIENAPIGDFMAGVIPSGFVALGQPFTCSRIQILAEPQKIVPLDGIPQTKFLRPQSSPLTKRLAVLTVVIADAQMLVKISFGVHQIRLRLPRKHRRIVAQTTAQDCSEA